MSQLAVTNASLEPHLQRLICRMFKYDPIKSAGTADYRVPDELTPTMLREIKNRAELAWTSQLQDFALFSQAQKPPLQFVIEIRENTVIRPTAQQYLQLNKVNVVRSLPSFP